ncbi:MAG: pyruvate dehydrogenase E2 component (dihydrolipoamide acetyltransferase) [Ilumatobacter sp.]|jgi:pyruvate dehydrogenase E2 component (dihydrolipoamide acetyltransferase)
MSIAPSALAEYSMPSLGADMDEGTVIEWLVGIGDTFERGQVVARIETEKSDIDIEIWHDGVVAEIVVGPNATVPVGTTLMRFHGVGVGVTETHAASVAPKPEPDGQTTPESSVVERTVDARRQGDSDVVWASPLARRLAGEQGIALADVVGSGPQGAVRARDLSGSVASSNDEPGDEVAVPPAARMSRSDRMRSMIAARMTRSNHEIPHYRLERNIDLGSLVEYLSTINEQRPIAQRVVPAAALVRAVAIAAARHPELNGTWSDDQFRPGPGVNVSVAISLRGGGLVTPTIRDADAASLDEVMALLREFTTAARSGTMRSEWTTTVSSITVTNLGERGADLVHGLISPPEVALVGFGRIFERPVVVDGVVVARPVVTATLGADHRATDGAVGSRFLSTVASALEEPECL